MLTIFFLKVLQLLFSVSVNEGTFPSVFKLADVTPFLKKGLKNSKDNYRPITISKTCINRWLPSWINTFPKFNVDLEKAHELLLGKLSTYSFNLSGLRLICS